MTEIKVSDYLSLIKESYENQGQLKGQREKLKTTSGTRIRARMMEDFKNNAILPPVVLGLVVSGEKYKEIASFEKEEELNAFLKEYDKSKISIIDGMQRTTVLALLMECRELLFIRIQQNSLKISLLDVNFGLQLKLKV